MDNISIALKHPAVISAAAAICTAIDFAKSAAKACSRRWGRLHMRMQQYKNERKSDALFEHLGGTSAKRLAYYGKLRCVFGRQPRLVMSCCGKQQLVKLPPGEDDGHMLFRVWPTTSPDPQGSGTPAISTSTLMCRSSWPWRRRPPTAVSICGCSSTKMIGNRMRFFWALAAFRLSAAWVTWIPLATSWRSRRMSLVSIRAALRFKTVGTRAATAGQAKPGRPITAPWSVPDCGPAAATAAL